MNNQSDTRTIRTPATINPAPLWQFTPFDKAPFSFILRGTWIFRGHLDADRMREGLVKLLTFYPHLTGRMEWDKGVRVNNAGIPFTIANEPGISIDEAAVHPESADRYSQPLSKRRMRSGKSPLMSVKLTRLGDGTVLGVRCTHSLFDGAGFYGMVNNWACLCRGQSVEPPVFDPTLLQIPVVPPQDDIVTKALSKGFVRLGPGIVLPWLKMLLPGRSLERTRGFHFSTETLKNLKKQVNDGAGCICSTNEALSALIIDTCARLNGHAGSATSYSSVNVIDCRTRIPSLSRQFARNAAYAGITPALPANAPVHAKARAIHDALAPLLASPSPELQDLMRVAAAIAIKKILLLPFDAAKVFCTKPTVIYINNFSRLPIYSVDFGTGIPNAVIPHNLTDPVLLWPAHPDKGGIEVYFTGSFAHAINKLKPDDPWLAAMEQLSAA